MANRKMGYKESLMWLIHNDDNTWLQDVVEHWNGKIDVSEASQSVTLMLLADIHGQDIDKAKVDLYKLWKVN